MDYKEEDFLQLSGLQHFRFCRRQWALIHIENLWSENLRTVEGELLHQRAHNAAQRESRGNLLITRDMRVFSATLGISGACDVVEFHKSGSGIPLPGKDGTYQPYPVEYKRGSPRSDDANHLQLCAQAMCLEEMLCCDIPEGALYYGETRHREKVDFTEELRQQVKAALQEMHQLYQRQYTPKVRPSKSCNACSLKELCLPKLMQKKSVAGYLQQHLEDFT
ncbi:MAG TPA: CRISPR-associated protein Cas4 [Firmicutes bacterium]|nr:CRISPR-associated protein Cas4 [Bacillota bacterium]